MNFKIGNYIECKIKKNRITKISLYNQLKEVFHKNEKDYVTYKGFAGRFYTKFYAEDLFQISYLLNIDLNKMRDEVINSNGNNNSKVLEIALARSNYSETYLKDYSKWFVIEDNTVYIIWFKLEGSMDLEYILEMYDFKKNTMKDITFLTCKAVAEMDKNWNTKSLDERLNSIKVYNKKVYDKLKS